jgi:hypothetical protein
MLVSVAAAAIVSGEMKMGRRRPMPPAAKA